MSTSGISMPSLKMSTVKIARRSPRRSWRTASMRWSRRELAVQRDQRQAAALNWAAMKSRVRDAGAEPERPHLRRVEDPFVDGIQDPFRANVITGEEALEVSRDVSTAFERRHREGRCRRRSRSSGTGERRPWSRACHRRMSQAIRLSNQ